MLSLCVHMHWGWGQYTNWSMNRFKKLETVIEICCGHFAEDPKQLCLKPFNPQARNKERLLFKGKVSQLCTTNILNYSWCRGCPVHVPWNSYQCPLYGNDRSQVVTLMKIFSLGTVTLVENCWYRQKNWRTDGTGHGRHISKQAWGGVEISKGGKPLYHL